jgi:hypothetical protein
MDESRKQFEDWFHSRYDSISMPPKDRVNLFTFSWAAWQASRAAIEIDAPAEPFYPMPKENSPTDHYHYGRQSIISKVRAAGIKVKE